MSANSILILGASARAAAFSAARAGCAPYWIDRYGDSDLCESFPGRSLGAADYPQGLIAAARDVPDMPFLITGAMENHLDVLEALAAERRLLGNDAAICRAVRTPAAVYDCLSRSGLAVPAVTGRAPGGGNWVCKPLHSAGGKDISLCGGDAAAGAGEYLQEFIEGRSLSAVFLADGRHARLAGVTRQLVGKAAFHAGRFAYCGSLGPLELTASEERQWSDIGLALAETFRIRGLFGVDAVQRGGSIYPVEINPRYTASVEVVEAGTGLALIAEHLRACSGELPAPAVRRRSVHGKCHLFAPERLVVQADLLTLPMPCELDTVTLADVPAPGTAIAAGHPVLTLLVEGRDQLECLQRLTDAAPAILKRVRGEG